MVQSESVLEMVKVDVCFAMSAVIGEFFNRLERFWHQHSQCQKRPSLLKNSLMQVSLVQYVLIWIISSTVVDRISSEFVSIYAFAKADSTFSTGSAVYDTNNR